MRVLVFIPAYNAENSITSVLDRIPQELAQHHEVHVLVSDDASRDRTFDAAKRHLAGFWCPGEVIRNNPNQGYGGNQKVGYRHAMNRGFDVVAMVHGDGQYAPECLPALLAPFERANPPDAVFGSRMMHQKDALKGGMPFYKFLANKFLTRLQNKTLGTNLTEFHSGYRLYRVEALRKLPLELNSQGFDFDTEIIIQVVYSGGTIEELPIPTHYGDEVCHVNGVDYALKILRASLKARLVSMGIFHDPKFAFPETERAAAVDPLSFASTSRTLFDMVPAKSRILDLGHSGKSLVDALETRKGCSFLQPRTSLARMRGQSGKSGNFKEPTSIDAASWDEVDVVLAQDLLGRADNPEEALRALRGRLCARPEVRVLFTCANTGFFITRLMLLAGQFNYSRRGILALHHKRLYTKSSFARALRYGGFETRAMAVVPPPWQMALGDTRMARLLFALTKPLARLLPGLFGWEFIFDAYARPSAAYVLKKAER